MTLLLLGLALFAIMAPAAALAWGMARPRRRPAEPPPAIPHQAYRTTILLGDCCLCIGKGQERRAA